MPTDRPQNQPIPTQHTLTMEEIMEANKIYSCLDFPKKASFQQ
jgi:hypothetical protein